MTKGSDPARDIAEGLGALRDEYVLITGGAGFIGSALARALAPHVRDVRLLDSLHEDVHGRSPVPPAIDGTRFTLGDVADAEVWDELLSVFRPTVIIHLAAETGTGQSLRNATRHGRVNVIGTTAMTDALLRNDSVPRHVLLASSRAVYGEGQWSAGGREYYARPRTLKNLRMGRWDPDGARDVDSRALPSRADRTEPRPTNIYAATKLAQEHILGAWAIATGVPLSILRLQNVYGPGQSLTNSYTGIVALFSRLSVQKQPIDLYEDGKIIRDFVFIDDVVQAMLRALTMLPAQNRVLDVGSGQPSTLRQVAEVLADLEDAPQPAVSGKFREGDVRAASCDIEMCVAELGYSPAHSLEDGLSKLVRWVRAELLPESQP